MYLINLLLLGLQYVCWHNERLQYWCIAGSNYII